MFYFNLFPCSIVLIMPLLFLVMLKTMSIVTLSKTHLFLYKE